MSDRGMSMKGLERKAEELSSQGKAPMFVSLDQNLVSIIAVADTLKENSKEAVDVLHQMGIEQVMITGDNRRTAEAIGRQIGIDRVLSDFPLRERPGWDPG